MKIDFEFTTAYGVYKDALYLDDNHQLTNTEIDLLKQERLDNWLYIIENPVASPDITVEPDVVITE